MARTFLRWVPDLVGSCRQKVIVHGCCCSAERAGKGRGVAAAPATAPTTHILYKKLNILWLTNWTPAQGLPFWMPCSKMQTPLFYDHPSYLLPKPNPAFISEIFTSLCSISTNKGSGLMVHKLAHRKQQGACSKVLREARSTFSNLLCSVTSSPRTSACATSALTWFLGSDPGEVEGTISKMKSSTCTLNPLPNFFLSSVITLVVKQSL